MFVKGERSRITLSHTNTFEVLTETYEVIVKEFCIRKCTISQVESRKWNTLNR